MSAALPTPFSSECCTTVCDEFSSTGPPGPPGNNGEPGIDGLDGVNAFTLTTGVGFTQPAISANVTVGVANSDWMAIGQKVFVQTGGYYTVVSTPSSLQVVLTNLGYTGNAAPGDGIASSVKVSPGGIKGVDGLDGTDSSVLFARATTVDATPTEMFLDGPVTRLFLPDNTAWAFSIMAVARRGDVDSESAAYKLEGCIDRNVGVATTALVGLVTKSVLAEDTVAWDINATADPAQGSLKLEFTGELAKIIQAVARIEITEVTTGAGAPAPEDPGLLDVANQPIGGVGGDVVGGI